MGKIFDIALVGLIVLNVVAVTLETVPSIAVRHKTLFLWIEYISVSVFTVEYLARFWCSIEDPTSRHLPIWRRRVRFVFSTIALIDLLAILPFFLSLAGILPVADGRALRAVRMIRVLKLTRYSRAMQSIAAALKNEQRTMVAALLVVIIALHLAATAIFLAEGTAQPDKFGSIPEAMWWAMATLTTVGYGDIVPVTAIGKLIGGLVMLSGIGLFALWTGLFASSFVDELRRRDFKVSLEMVGQVPAFNRLEAAQIGEIAGLLVPLIVPPRQMIIRKGEHADRMFFIASGEVEVEFYPNPARLGPGDFFGEVGLLHGAVRNATVVSLKETRLMVLDADTFFDLMRRHPALNDAITEIATRRHAAHLDAENNHTDKG
ncbi:MAG: cyclic nucleotide-gated ion channel [Alphaproteobacteria bacterium]|nr:cyclic nucleotide-gated ion channel [Alphaproteobacteria bacterium]